ncbi:hypothetical protein ACFU98_43480 [Streptomyces sp. NPDC057575]|uniref:hypothetical protein n=1 Tax=Streptomyces sp. NPDC057575 TaxID=3346170 RepID=UPI003678B2F2
MLRTMKQRLAVGAAAACTVASAALAAPTAVAGAAAGSELTYGSDILLQNQYGGDGGYLDTNGHSTQPGATYDVSTNQTPNSRGPATSVWKVVSASGKASGTRVTSGDVIYLVNQYGSGTYLDTNGHSTQHGAKYKVSTSHYTDRATGTGTWKVLPAT